MAKDKDLRIKIGTKDEVLWTGVLRECKIRLEGAKEAIIIQTEIIKVAEQKIKDEQKKKKPPVGVG